MIIPCEIFTWWSRRHGGEYIFEKGFSLSGGIFFEGEIDAEAARVLGVRGSIVPARGAVTPEAEATAEREQAAADWTLLPELVYTQENLATLDAALRAKRVLVVEDRPIPNGRIFGLLGPNGAGKTTLMKILEGLTRPDSGSVSLGVLFFGIAIRLYDRYSE